MALSNNKTGRLPRWLIFAWAGLLLVSGGLWLFAGDYQIGATKLEFLTNAPSAQAGTGNIGYVTGGRIATSLPLLNGLFMATMPDNKIMALDHRADYLFDPSTREFNMLSGIGIDTSTDGGLTGTIDVPIDMNDAYNGFGRYGNVLIGQNVWQISGYGIKAISPDGIRNYPLDAGFGGLPFVVKLSDKELLIAGVGKASSRGVPITLTNKSNDPTNKSKLFKYNIDTQKLSDTGKVAPVLLGDREHFTTYYDFGDRVLLWERYSGSVYLLNKRTLGFKKVADGLQEAIGTEQGTITRNLFFHMYPISKSMVLLAQPSITMNDSIYIYNRYSNKLTKFKLSSAADAALWVRAKYPSTSGSTLSEKDIKYIPMVSGGRFLSLIPFQQSSFSGQLTEIWSHRLVLDLGLKRFVDVVGQPVKMKAGLVKTDIVHFLTSWMLPTGWFWLSDASGQDALYWPGVSMAPIPQLTWRQLDYLLSFMFLSLLLGGLLTLYLKFRQRSTANNVNS